MGGHSNNGTPLSRQSQDEYITAKLNSKRQEYELKAQELEKTTTSLGLLKKKYDAVMARKQVIEEENKSIRKQLKVFFPPLY